MRIYLLLPMFLFAALASAWSQQGPVPAFAQGNGGSDEAVVLPSVLSGDSATPLFPAGGERSNYLSGGFKFATAYDDNILASPTDRLSDTSFALRPFVSINQTRSRLRWQADYSPGFTFYRRFDSQDQDDHNLNLAFEYRLSPHVTLKLKDALLKTSNFLGGLSQAQQSPFGVVQQANPTIITPITDRISNTGSGELSWQFGPNSVMGARGLSDELHFPEPQPAGGLSDSHSQAAEAYVAHRISQIHWIGVSYRYQRILTDLNGAATFTHSLLASYTLNVTPSMSFTLFGGPQHAETSSQLVQASGQWLPAAGATYAWQGTRAGFEAGLIHKISDGGGLAGAVQLTAVEASARFAWTRHWSARVGGSYGKDQVIDALTSSPQHARSATGVVVISRQIGEHLTLEASYVRADQKYLDAVKGWSAFNRNRPQLSVSYSFSRPIGR